MVTTRPTRALGPPVSTQPASAWRQTSSIGLSGQTSDKPITGRPCGPRDAMTSLPGRTASTGRYLCNHRQRSFCPITVVDKVTLIHRP